MSNTSLNKMLIIGNLGADPEVRYTQGGTAVATLSVATAERWRDKNSGEWQENTEWHRVVMFARLAEVAGEYLHKGSKVYVEGRVQTRKFQGRDGQDRYITEVKAAELQMLDGPRTGSDAGPSRSGGQSTNQRQHNPPPAPEPSYAGGGATDEDVPFFPIPDYAI